MAIRDAFSFMEESVKLWHWTGIGCAVFLVSAQAGDLDDGIKLHERGVYAKAAEAFERASAKGIAEAQRRLGFMYYHGEGVRQDNVRAVAFLEKAAHAGDAGSARDLGTMYEYGMSVAQDEGRSAGWFRRAAELGDPHSQFRLGIMYYQGEGVARDRIEAAKWWTVAMSNSPEWEKRIRPQIASAEAKLSAEENAQGRRKAAEWLRAREANR